MTYEQKRKLHLIIETYGHENQVNKAIEECEELIEALKIEKSGKGDSAAIKEAIIDEIADVEVMINQLKIMFFCTAEVDERIDFKINRQIERLRKGE